MDDTEGIFCFFFQAEAVPGVTASNGGNLVGFCFCFLELLVSEPKLEMLEVGVVHAIWTENNNKPVISKEKKEREERVKGSIACYT